MRPEADEGKCVVIGIPYRSLSENDPVPDSLRVAALWAEEIERKV
jgi:hypothetical protein